MKRIVRQSSVLRRKGLGLIELIVSLTISAMLLTAVGAAYSVSTSAIEMNDQFFRASQTARVCINQIMSEIRRCQSAVVDDPSLEMTTQSGVKRLYTYDSATSELRLSLPDEDATKHFVLARNVSSCVFETDGDTIVMKVTIRVGSNNVMLIGSGMPRRAVTFN